MSHARPLFLPLDAARRLPAAVIDEATHWLVRLQSGQAGDAEQAGLLAWRQAHPDHELAWQRLGALGQDLRTGAGTLPSDLARRLLEVPAGPSRRTVLKSLAGLVLVAGAGTWTVREARRQGFGADYRTARGEWRTLQLPDGTQLLLGTATAVDVHFGATERRLSLRRGEVLVRSGHDAAGRPLVVGTPSGRVVPVGTRFTVRYEPDQDADLTQVAVLEGAVDLLPRDGGMAQRLRAGEQGGLLPGTALAPQALAAPAAAWTDRMLVAERMRLDDFLAELGRYRPGWLRCAPEVASLRVSGAFALDDTDAVLALLQETLPVEARFRSRYWVTVGPR